MSKNLNIIPYTELVERVFDIAKSGAPNSKPRVRGAINDVYTKEIGSKFDWNFLEAHSSLTLTERYNTGTVSANTGSATLTFSGATLTQAMVTRKIKITGNDNVYEILTYVSTSECTIKPVFSGTENLSGANFEIFQPIYPLAPDFDRFPVKGGLIKYRGGKKDIIEEKSHIDYYNEFSAVSSDSPIGCRIVERDTAGNLQLEIIPPPKNALSYDYDYFKELKPMRESSSGTVTITSGGTAVTASTDARFLEMSTGDYLRVNANGTKDDSEWYKIVAISNNSALTLATIFVATSSVATAEYIISSVPKIPTMLHSAILHGAIREIIGNQNDPMYAYHHLKMATILTDAKVRFVTRQDSVEIETVAEEWNYRL
jgi:hypothetical protein